jgi:Domain of unknown function (DUF4124)
MKRFSLVLLLALASLQASAQVLYKYVDANGKVTYSDRAPKAGEKAERIQADTKTNVISSPVSASGGASNNGKEGSADINVRVKERAALRDTLKGQVDAARAELERAKLALEEGKTPREGEQRIIVKPATVKAKDGTIVTVPTVANPVSSPAIGNLTPTPAGQNVVTRTDAYSERIAGLEAAVKEAEAKLELAETNYRRGAPD